MLFIVFVLIISGIIFFINNLKPVSNDSSQIIVKIPQGSSFNEIVSKLEETGLIRSEKIFKVFVIFSGKAHQLKPGKYFLSRSLSAKQIIDNLIIGPKEISITIIPGKTLKEIDDLLAESGIIGEGELINLDVNEIFSINPDKYSFLEKVKSLEGFLFPDTYRFFVGETAKNVALRVVDNFYIKALPIFKKDDNIPKASEALYKTLILASFLEREIPIQEDQKIAAGILEKRLKLGMPLQVDATILYAKCDGKFNSCPLLQKEDFKIKSDYNTYLFNGLTPTPISNPATSTIEAALNPISSSYFYYLSIPNTNQTIFSKTLEEHNRNRF